MKREIHPSAGRVSVYAGDYLLLDSHVMLGGGTNQTALVQAILDQAKVWGQLHLIMDGAALVDGLKIHANTTIECLNPSCGFFLDDHRNEALLSNAEPCFTGERKGRNIRLIGGTYNHNGRNQAHHVDKYEAGCWLEEGRDWVMCMKWYGVENLSVEGVRIINQSTFAIHIANFKGVWMENVQIDLQHTGFLRNQDGIHFWGPGQFATMINIRGTSGDDFIALAPDEHDGISSITDVLIDGVHLDNADQGIRLLSKGLGRLDRINIRNISGTYKSFGFFINPWFYGTQNEGGSYGNLLIENVDLRQTTLKYTHYSPFLFRIGGNIEVLTLRNIHCHLPADQRPLIEIDQPFYEPHPCAENRHYVCDIGALIIDGLRIFTDPSHQMPAPCIYINGLIHHLLLKDIRLFSRSGIQLREPVMSLGPGSTIHTLETYGIPDEMAYSIQAVTRAGDKSRKQYAATDTSKEDC